MGVAVVPHSDDLPPVAVAHREHTVQFYGEDSSLLDELSRFVATELVAGNAAVVIATKAHREGLAQRVQARGFDIARAVEQGRYIALDAADTLRRFIRDGWPDAALFNDTVGSVLGQVMAILGSTGRVAAFGEMVALLWARGQGEAAIRLEQLWNTLAQSFPLSLRCGYPMSGFNREDHSDSFARICAEHSHVIPLESYTALCSEEERYRTITHLQQKAQALETEVAERRQVEEELRRIQANLESKVEERTAALRQLSSRLLSMQDIERRRIARELHDSLGQYLIGLKLNTHMLRQSPQREELWFEAEELMERCISEVRTLSYLLHPPTLDAAGFASAARWYVEGYRQRSGVWVTLDAPRNPRRLPDAVELALFRVLQEALTNVHRHSGASAAYVLVQQETEQVILEVKDNGRGITKDLINRFTATGVATGVGIAGIQERVRELGGTLALASDSGGTRLRVVIPLPPNESKSDE
jgi:signal transduction histidine kinase